MSEAAASRVLYVEDEEMIQDLVAAALEDAGFRVTAVETGRAALNALDGGGETFVAVVTDIKLPAGPQGWDVARRARELTPSTPVVYVTGDSIHDFSSQGVPGSVMLQKPFSPAEVAVALSKLLKG